MPFADGMKIKKIFLHAVHENLFESPPASFLMCALCVQVSGAFDKQIRNPNELLALNNKECSLSTISHVGFSSHFASFKFRFMLMLLAHCEFNTVQGMLLSVVHV